jgi:hypothetical protein
MGSLPQLLSICFFQLIKKDGKLELNMDLTYLVVTNIPAHIHYR